LGDIVNLLRGPLGGLLHTHAIDCPGERRNAIAKRYLYVAVLRNLGVIKFVLDFSNDLSVSCALFGYQRWTGS
jgi:hypothetical protein